jgi:hypothetical protein
VAVSTSVKDPEMVPGPVLHEYPPATTGEDRVQDAAAGLLNPLPVKVTVVSTGPELGDKITCVAPTVNCFNADGDPVVSVKIMVYAPAPVFATMKLPLIVPLVVCVHE